MDNHQGEVVLVKDINSNDNGIGYNSEFIEFNGKLYFIADNTENGGELWVSDGTTEGTNLLKDIRAGNRGSSVRGLTEFNGKLYFTANNTENGQEPWVSDGTTEGTNLLIDIDPNNNNDNYSGYSYGLFADEFTEFNGKLYFTADDGQNGQEPWVTDGTTEGTNLFKDIFPGFNSSYTRKFTEFDGKLYFIASDGVTGEELWVTDGTTEGTNLLKDIRAVGGGFSYSDENLFGRTEFIEFDDKLYFNADDGETGEELWVTDGTTEGTNLLIDINPGVFESEFGTRPNFSYPRNFIEFNGKLYFTAREEETGAELWVSDGTTEGTKLLKNINPDEGGGFFNSGSSPSNFIEFNNKLYFTADDGENRFELWVSDGTTEGTNLLKDINPGNDSSVPSYFIEFNNRLYFSADDGENGKELWVTDGTAEGTTLVADINPGSQGSYPENFTVVGDELFFSAATSETGTELYKLTFDGSVNPDEPNTINGTDASDNLIGTDDANIINGLGSSDTLNGGDGNDLLSGGNGRDLLLGGDGSDTLAGEVNQDTLDGGDGNDLLSGGGANDSLLGGDGDDSLAGDAANDTLNGGDGNDLLSGGDGQDSLLGGDGDDSLAGEVNQDTLNGGAGNDTLSGGGGQDLFVLSANNGVDTITDFNLGQDRFELVGGLSFDDLTLTGNQIEVADDILAIIEGVDASSLSASDFSETESEEPTNPNSLGFIEGTLDADLIDGTDSPERIKGLAGNDVIRALSGNDTVFGDVGNDDLEGNDDNDVIYGGTGNDTIDGGMGNDVLVGQEGNDFFVLTPGEGEDLVTDFSLEQDRFLLSEGLSYEDLSFTESSIYLGDETLVTVEGIETTALTTESFL